ncbi:hypothetical protein SAMN04487948_10413 [Halogranum amylolyticum]|uniref:Uncharacterized protein n=1 Tax=Halogranum amylolyticum TaxID=660520 RepID=A0A1H8RH32_9EURY|nr:hypothetical protein [Halogranum amylolyticum]SEO65632.1 hypothetical protein SAMN04487948_10413 [Halogranum amylolyticum]
MALVDSILIAFISLLIGGLGIMVGARLVIDDSASYGYAFVTAAIGALVWAVMSFFVGWLPLIGPILMLIVWVGVINWRYPGGWASAAGVGFVAWLAAVVVLYALSLVGLVAPGALGIPGA